MTAILHHCSRILQLIDRIRVLEARNLPAMDSNGKSDPYCIVRVGQEEGQTETRYKTLNPTWDEVQSRLCKGVQLHCY